MDEQKNNKRVSMSFKDDELSAKRIRLFNSIAQTHANLLSRGGFMEKAIELLARDVLGDRGYDNTIELIEGYLETQIIEDDPNP